MARVPGFGTSRTEPEGKPLVRATIAIDVPFTVRSECLDHVLVYGRRHLDRVLRVYVSHYRSSGRIGAGPSHASRRRLVTDSAHGTGRINRRDVLKGLIHQYG
jgi:hypothetical protein